MTPEEVIKSLETIMYIDYDGDFSEGPPGYVIDCIRALIAQRDQFETEGAVLKAANETLAIDLQKAEAALQEIRDIETEYSNSTIKSYIRSRALEEISTILDTYYKEEEK